jgi:hypothetical protein
MYPAEPLTPFQKKLTRICLRMNNVVLGILLAISWQAFPIFSGILIELVPVNRLPVVVQLGIGLFHVICSLAIIPAGFLLIMAVSNYARIVSVFLPESAPRDIPEGQYSRDLAHLVTAGEPIIALGFIECDRYYLAGTYRLLAIVYRHPEENIYWSTVRFIGRLTVSVIDSSFENNTSLETSAVAVAGKSPRRAGAYLQVAPMVSPQTLLTLHQEAIALFTELGYTCQASEDIRYAQLSDLQRYSSHVRTFAYWPIRNTLWTIFGSNAQYCKPLREQVAAGTATIPVR